MDGGKGGHGDGSTSRTWHEEAAMTEDEEFTPDDVELSELESEDLTDHEVAGIRESRQQPDTADPDDPEVS
jgi:hypothetical protein